MVAKEKKIQSPPEEMDTKFEFWIRRSTINAIDRVKSLAQAAVFQDGMVLVVSIDIVNAFNSLPWAKIRRASGKEKHVSRENQLQRPPPFQRENAKFWFLQAAMQAARVTSDTTSSITPSITSARTDSR